MVQIAYNLCMLLLVVCVYMNKLEICNKICMGLRVVWNLEILVLFKKPLEKLLESFVASNRLKIRYIIAGCMGIPDLRTLKYSSKLLWVYGSLDKLCNLKALSIAARAPMIKKSEDCEKKLKIELVVV